MLENVNFVVRPREAVCIVGPNGGGKTTLLKLILGLVQPGSGEVRVFGQPPRAVRLRMGYMPQQVQHDMQFPATVMDIVLMGRLGRRGCAGCSAGTARTTAVRPATPWRRSAWKTWHAGRWPPCPAASGNGCSSPGPFAAEPELLLLDEPTANVDSLVEARLFEILREINRRLTVVVVSHDLGFVSNLVESVMCVNRRAVVHPASQLTGELIREIYGGDVRMVRHERRRSATREHVKE